jgi:hypothetical protein
VRAVPYTGGPHGRGVVLATQEILMTPCGQAALPPRPLHHPEVKIALSM